MGGLCVVLLALAAGLGRAQPPGAVDQADMASNMKKFQELYGIATQLMNLGGNILNNAQSSGGGSASSSSRLSGADFSSAGGNGVLGEVVRPQLRGVAGYDVASSSSALDKLGGGGLSEYGAGPLGAGSKSQPRSILDTLMGSFLGSSLSGAGSSSPSAASIFQPSYGEEYGEPRARFGGAQQGSNIDAIVQALSRSGAKRAAPEPESGLNAGSLLSQFFGGGR